MDDCSVIRNLWCNFKKEPIISFLFIILIAVTAFILFTSYFEVKYASDELSSVNNTYTHYYTDRRQYVTAVKKFIGYSRSMIFGGIFAGFLKLAAAGFAVGALAVFIITVTPMREIQMFGALSLNLPTVLFSVAATACLAFIFAVIAVNRTYSRDTSDVIRE